MWPRVVLHVLAQGFPLGEHRRRPVPAVVVEPGQVGRAVRQAQVLLNFELDQYVEAVKEFPSPNAKIRTPKGKAVVFKMDIFQRLVYFLQLGEPGSSPIAMNVEDAKELMPLPRKGRWLDRWRPTRLRRSRRGGQHLRQRRGPEASRVSTKPSASAVATSASPRASPVASLQAKAMPKHRRTTPARSRAGTGTAIGTATAAVAKVGVAKANRPKGNPRDHSDGMGGPRLDGMAVQLRHPPVVAESQEVSLEGWSSKTC